MGRSLRCISVSEKIFQRHLFNSVLESISLKISNHVNHSFWDKQLKFWIDGSGLIGTIPTEIGMTIGLTELLLDENNLIGTIPNSDQNADRPDKA